MDKNENILDEAFNELPSQNKWKLAIQSIIVLAIGSGISMFFQNYIPAILFQYALMIFTLYIFIKRINYDDIEIGELFLWGTFIIFGSYLLLNTYNLIFLSDRITDSVLSFIMFNFGSLIRSIILGNMLSLGVFHLIKNNSKAMLFLMILMSWMFQTLLIFDLSVFEG